MSSSWLFGYPIFQSAGEGVTHGTDVLCLDVLVGSYKYRS
jgi:hypothetical protein